VRVTLLADIRTVFRIRGADRTSSAALVETLRELDNGLWSEWRGPNDDRPPHKLTQGELAQLLRPFWDPAEDGMAGATSARIEAPAATSPRNSRQHGRHTPTRWHSDTGQQSHTVAEAMIRHAARRRRA
jgi:hypothetical protein